ncbi:MAG: polysaccharide biosynthesis tyrosine autokinase, partial [Cyanobacteria bacterium P01_F01_bin.42]
MTASSRTSSRPKVLLSALGRRYGTGLAIGIPVMGLFTGLAFLSPAYYQATGKLKMLTPTLAPQPEEPAQSLPSLTADSDLLRSSELISTTLQNLKEDGVPITQDSQDSFKRSLTLSASSSQQSITLFFNDPNPKNAAKIVNRHMEVFKANKEQAKYDARVQVRQQIEQRLPQATANFESAQKELREFQQQFQAVTANTSSDSAALAFQQAQQELQALKQQNNGIETLRKQLLEKLGVNASEAETLAAVSRSTQFRKLIKELRQMQTKLQRRRSELTEQHPEVINLKRDISDLRRGLTAEIQRVTGNDTIRLNLLLEQQSKQVLTSELVELEVQRTQIQNRIRVLNQALGPLQQSAVKLPQIEQKSEALERQVSQTQESLEALLRQRRGVIQALSSNSAEVKIINRATVPTQRITPFQRPLLWSGLVACLGLAGLGMWIAEMRDRSLKTVADAEKFLDLKVLGVIPTFETPAPSQLYDGDLQRNIPAIFPVDQPGSAISEAFRMLYLNLKVLPNHRNLQSFAITSSIPQEGKSTIAANLAAVLAQAGKSVLLVDANLHHPFQSLIWNLNSEIGLSDILFSQTSFLLAVNPINNNLDVLTSGSIQNLERNSFESKQMKLFIADMSSRYDCLILDLPSVNVSADAAIISQMVDGVIFISKPGRLDEFNASKAKRRLAQSNANVLGMILNGSNDPQDNFLSLVEDDEIDLDLEDVDPDEDIVVGADSDLSQLGNAPLPQELEIPAALAN